MATPAPESSLLTAIKKTKQKLWLCCWHAGPKNDIPTKMTDEEIIVNNDEYHQFGFKLAHKTEWIQLKHEFLQRNVHCPAFS